MSVGDGPFSPLLTRTTACHSSSSTIGFRSTINSSPCQASQKEQTTKPTRFTLCNRQHDRNGTWITEEKTRATWC